MGTAKIKRSLKNLYVRFLAGIFPSRIGRDKKYFLLWEKKGFHVTPVHYEEPLPIVSQLDDKLWQKNSELTGITMNDAQQISLIDHFASKFKEEYESFPRTKTAIPYQFYLNNITFSTVDAELLYCVIRQFKPKKIVEIGSGASTYLAVQAINKNETETGRKTELISVEPFPNEVLKKGFPGLSRLIVQKVQDVPLEEFESLGENDILFIDSSHSLKIGSDVQYEFLEILPHLKKGVIVHIHDIFLPSDYPKQWVMNDFRFLNEQYLLQAFLIFNDHFEVLLGGSYLHAKFPSELESAFSSYKRDIDSPPGSFWMRKIK